MGSICCGSDNHLENYEETMEILLNNLLIRELSFDQMKNNIRKFLKQNEDNENLIEDMKLLFIETDQNINSNLIFQNKFYNKFVEKLENIEFKNILILAYPLLKNKKNITADPLFTLLKEKFHAKFTYECLEKIFIYICTFYTLTLNAIFADILEDENERNTCIGITKEVFNKKKIEEYVSLNMQKNILISSGIWDTEVESVKFMEIAHALGLDDIDKIRNNLIYFEDGNYDD